MKQDFIANFKRVVLVVGALIGAILFYTFVILDWSGRPFCHKQITLSLLQRIEDPNSHINAFPNSGGKSRDSLELIRDQMNGQMDWVSDYNYIPGLRQDDPADLVLLYFNRPTRWIWHGPPRTIFRKKMWIIVPIDRDIDPAIAPDAVLGEQSESVSMEEFVRRVKRTLDFVRTNHRPNWETVVAEHETFLKTVER